MRCIISSRLRRMKPLQKHVQHGNLSKGRLGCHKTGVFRPTVVTIVVVVVVVRRTFSEKHSFLRLFLRELLIFWVV